MHSVRPDEALNPQRLELTDGSDNIWDRLLLSKDKPLGSHKNAKEIPATEKRPQLQQVSPPGCTLNCTWLTTHMELQAQ